MFFVTRDILGYQSLWQSDGTPSGTHPVKGLVPAQGHSFVGTISANGTLYAWVSGGVGAGKLWKTDGTAAGTTLVAGIDPGPKYFQGGLWMVNGTLFLSFNSQDYQNPGGAELWASDGTAAGTRLVKRFDPGFFISEGVAINGTLFVSVVSSTPAPPNLYQLWASNGTAAGTRLLKQFAPGNQGLFSFTLNSKAFQGNLLFTAGENLWKSDGTAAGTAPVRTPGGTPLAYPYLLADVQNTLYVAALIVLKEGPKPEFATVMWKLGGPAQQAVLLPNPLATDGRFLILEGMTWLNGTLLFTENDGHGGLRLWRTGGTPAGVSLVKDIPGGDARPLQSGSMFHYNGRAYFNVSTAAGFQLWRTDGTPAGTAPVPGAPTSASPVWALDTNGVLRFLADDGIHGQELWELDPKG